MVRRSQVPGGPAEGPENIHASRVVTAVSVTTSGFSFSILIVRLRAVTRLAARIRFRRRRTPDPGGRSGRALRA